MRILCDFHHSSLYSSYLYTLEGRLGHEVYRQIGTKWFDKGYWRINRQKDTIQQYLGTYGYQPTDGTPSLNNTLWVKDGIYYSRDPNTGQVHKAIEFDTFMEMDFDVIIASIPDHIKPFKELARKKKAKFILQIGNEWDISPYQLNEETHIDNLMASVFPREFGVEHTIFYKQEFDTTIFNYQKPTHNTKMICNYMNVLQNYPEALELFLALEKEMPEYTFKMYGAQNRDGTITGVQNLANSMKKARWIFHVKPYGDGYGHCIHNAFAVGRPLIVNKSHYDGKLAGTLLRDQKNCLVIDSLSVKEIADSIRTHEERNIDLGRHAYNLFKDYCNFEEEAKRLNKFLTNLI